MRLLAYRPLRLTPRITLVECRRFPVPLRQVFDKWCVEVDSTPPNPDDVLGERPVLGPLLFQGARKATRGFLVYEDLESLILFLARRVRSVGVPRVDCVLSKESNGKSRAIRQVLASIEEEVPQHRRIGGGFSGATTPLFSATCFGDATRRNLVRIDQGGVTFYLPKLDDSDGAVFFRDLKETIGGCRVPRRRFICCSKDWLGRGAEGKRPQILCFDGSGSIRVVYDLPSVSSRLLEDLERGSVRKLEEQELLPRFDLEPVALLRIPPEKEAKRLLSRLPNVLRKRPRFRGTALLVRETSEPVPVPTGGPVITDAIEVLSILARTRNGAYVREDLPDLAQTWFRRSESFVTLNRVRP